jgi:hypothetical protein
MRKGREGGPEKEELGQGESSPGIVVTDTTVDSSQNGDGPRIAAFIWGGKVAPTATLPYGRWKGAA